MVFKMTFSPKDEKLFHSEENIFTIGRGSYTGAFDISLVWARNVNVLVGRFCSLASNISFLIGGNHPLKNVVSTYPFDTGHVVKKVFGEVYPDILPVESKRINPIQVIIGHDVWIGRNVTIMGGVKIGNGAVIGTNAVVAKDIPPYAIAVGNPARIIKYRFDEETIRKLFAVKWWNWDLKKIADNFPLINDVEKFLETHYSPELENFPEDDFSRQIKKFFQWHGKIYQFITDFRATKPLWPKVIKDFQQANSANDLLVIWLDTESTEEDSQSLTAAIGESKNILTFKHDKNFSPFTLCLGTHFITTREMTTLEALDYLWNTDVKIVSALDNDIFKGA